MSAATLIAWKLNVDLGYVSAPDLRNTGQAFNGTFIYEVKSEDMEPSTVANIQIWKSSIDIYCISTTVILASSAAQGLTNDLNGATWTNAGESVFMCKVTGASHGYLEESKPGDTDRNRYSMINILMFHQN
jgi:hypothetical protein